MTPGAEPTLLASMATSRPTRWTVLVLCGAVLAMLLLAAFAAGAVHATETRFAAIEKALEASQGADRGRHDRDEMTRRDVFEQLIELRTKQEAQGVMLLQMRDDVRAIRDAVAPLPRPKE